MITLPIKDRWNLDAEYNRPVIIKKKNGKKVIAMPKGKASSTAKKGR